MPKNVLLTGASGVIGSALLGQLSHHHVTCLTHRRPVRGTAAGHPVVSVRGDTSRPDFGLAPDAYHALAENTDVVVHCAGNTSFDVASETSHRVNADGARNMVRFARRSGAVLHHVSTAFVVRRTREREVAGESATTAGHYLDSKRAAEEALAEEGHTGTVLRPGIVIGHSVTGRISALQGLHSIMLATLQNTLPMAPVLPDHRIDFLPVDVVARAIRSVVDHGVDTGEHWLTAGDAALPAQRLIDLILEVAREHGLEPPRPRLVEPDVIDRLIRPVFLGQLPERDRGRFETMLGLTELFDTAECFPSTLGTLPGIAQPTSEELADACRASVAYLIRIRRLDRRGAAA
ncbi:SDR family oxidoreductase [Streptomyces huiliensis]|uniref:SDR family oxidoreductase n=1 Tax=Streptomyces huiliensis TaxID=2876027 RepID=UPI001CBCB442|nr:SDR family oxidoreductase [Streptomyces huiliensis]MBZ4323785.1 SDR family oxidoreductase [Streptomyces huiliensis]